MEIKLRFNHNATNLAEKWRLFINGSEILVASVIFQKIEVQTTMDIINNGDASEEKYHVSCRATQVFFSVTSKEGKSLGITAIIQ